MPASIACICGYRGPAVTADGGSVCPICRTPDTPASAGGLAAAAAAGGPSAEPTRGMPSGAAPAPLHIPCPRGHVLEAPAALLGQRVVCPQCNQFFVFDAENSVERVHERERERAEREAREARQWLLRAIGMAALVLAALVTMVVVSTLRR